MPGNTFDIPDLVIIMIAIVACLFSIATSSITIKTFNDNNEYKQKNIHDFRYMIFNIVISIIFLIIAFVALGLKIHLMRN